MLTKILKRFKFVREQEEALNEARANEENFKDLFAAVARTARQNRFDLECITDEYSEYLKRVWGVLGSVRASGSVGASVAPALSALHYETGQRRERLSRKKVENWADGSMERKENGEK